MVKRLEVVALLLVTTLCYSPSAAVAQQSTMTAMQPVVIERAETLDKGKVAIDAGLALETDREFAGVEYDNMRLAPLGVRFGLNSGIEIGANLALSSNDANQSGAPNKSGLEGISLFGKLKLNQSSTLRVGLVAAGDNDIAPYPNDGIDIFANLAVQKPIDAGLLYGELGYKAQGGDFDVNNYFNYGVGLAVPVAETIGLNLELVGEQAQEIGVSNTLDLVFGANLLFGDAIRLAPYVSFGVNDASPDVATGALLELRI
ncbi:MAG TPA: hypothetical protein VJ974_06990 [Geopsychrobacteraceae bacterium]|nr:hypothetical protein [Geopsychrobacteraceae bacterium]